MENIDRIVKSTKKVTFHGKCSWFKCKKEIKGTAYTDALLAILGFVFCSRECIKENLEYAASEEAIENSAEVFL